MVADYRNHGKLATTRCRQGEPVAAAATTKLADYPPRRLRTASYVIPRRGPDAIRPAPLRRTAPSRSSKRRQLWFIVVRH